MTVANNLKPISADQILDRNYTIFSKKYGVNYNKQQLDNATHYLSQQICQRFDDQPAGRVIFIYSNELFWIIATLRASWKLGCVIFAADYNPAYNRIPEFKNFHNFIDLVIGHDQAHTNSCVGVLEQKPHILFEPCNIDHVSNPNLIFANNSVNPESPAVITHTSGTTGYPKLIYFSHSDVVNIANSQVSISCMESDEFPGHQKTLHHGSLFLNYALPLLSICDRHYCLHNSVSSSSPTDNVKEMLELVVEHNLTRIMIPYNWIRFASQLDGPNLQQKVYIHSILGATDKEMQRIVDVINPKAVINMWGSTETGSCFHSMTNRSNIDTYNPNRFDIINADIDYLIEEDCIKLKWKFSNDWQVIGDKFDVEQQVLWWRGRVNFISRDGVRVNVENIKTFLEDKFDTFNFTIVIDYELNQLYLAVYDSELPVDLNLINNMLEAKFNSAHTINKIKVLNYGRLLMGMKPSQPILLYMFRNNERSS